jgi:hypothetical protein
MDCKALSPVFQLGLNDLRRPRNYRRLLQRERGLGTKGQFSVALRFAHLISLFIKAYYDTDVRREEVRHRDHALPLRLVYPSE